MTVNPSSPLERFRALSAAIHALTGTVCAAAAALHLWSVGTAGSGVILLGHEWGPGLQVTIGLLVLAPAVLVTISCVPMFAGGHRSFRSGAAAGSVLGVSLIGTLALFGGRNAQILLGVIAFDLLVMAAFATVRRRAGRRRMLSPDLPGHSHQSR